MWMLAGSCGSDTAFNSSWSMNKVGGCRCGGRSCNDDNIIQPAKQQFQSKQKSPKNIALKPRENCKKEWNRITLYWCAKCKAWHQHNTNQYMDQGKYEKYCWENYSSSVATESTESTIPNTVLTTNQSVASTLTDDKESSVTFASSFCHEVELRR